MHDLSITPAELEALWRWVRLGDGLGDQMAAIELTRLPNGALRTRQGDDEEIFERSSED